METRNDYKNANYLVSILFVDSVGFYQLLKSKIYKIEECGEFEDNEASSEGLGLVKFKDKTIEYEFKGKELEYIDYGNILKEKKYFITKGKNINIKNVLVSQFFLSNCDSNFDGRNCFTNYYQLSHLELYDIDKSKYLGQINSNELIVNNFFQNNINETISIKLELDQSQEKMNDIYIPFILKYYPLLAYGKKFKFKAINFSPNFDLINKIIYESLRETELLNKKAKEKISNLKILNYYESQNGKLRKIEAELISKEDYQISLDLKIIFKV